MIDRQQAEQLADEWARRDSLRLGYECRAMLDEFDLGYVIRSTSPRGRHEPRRPTDHRRQQGDRRGHHLAPVPAAVVQQMYRRSRPTGTPAPRTVDPASLLLREIRRLPTPATVAHLTVGGRTYLGHGVKGECRCGITRWSGPTWMSCPPGTWCAGAYRHAELIVVSDVLHDHDHRRAAAGQPPLTMREAESLLLATGVDVFLVREPGDPQAGPAERPCDSCLNFLVHFAVPAGRSWRSPRQWRPEPAAAPEPDRFAAGGCRRAGRRAGWRTQFR